MRKGFASAFGNVKSNSRLHMYVCTEDIGSKDAVQRMFLTVTSLEIN